MNYEEALEWLRGERSMTNTIPQDPINTWQVRIAEADAAATQQAYWMVKAHREGLLEAEHAAPLVGLATKPREVKP